jgi:SAM-dependent methyltransferase
MEVIDRTLTEQAFHDRQAGQRAAFFREDSSRLVVSEDEYLDHEPWIRPSLASLGDLLGRSVLDFGCGHGMAAIVFAKRGAQVTAFDLSGGYVHEARDRARVNGVAIDFVLADGAHLPFADAAFDYIWGNAVLHHLDMARAGRELRRVLKPRGRAVFCEPWGGNPFLNWARRHLAYPGKERTPEEKPLTALDVCRLREIFPRVECRGYQLLSMVKRVLGNGPFVKVLARWDDRLLTRLSFLQRWCRYVAITLHA